MRKLLPLLLILASCATGTAPSSSGTPKETSTQAAGPWGLTVSEEARILALEDRREYNPELVAAWVKNPNSLHRQRIALALARIGPATFIDKNGDGFYDPPEETRAGLEELVLLSKDPDRNVRETAAFALGELADPAGTGPLFAMTLDADAGVAAEATEAISKYADVTVREDVMNRYTWLTQKELPQGVRARAARFLFRFDNDRASRAAQAILADPSSAVRQEAAYSLARRPHAPARAELELLFNDENVLTRAFAVTAVGKISDPASVGPVVAALGDAHPWVRTNAAVALGRIAEKNGAKILREEDLPRIFAAIEDPDPGVRASMVETLAYYAEQNETARKRLLDIFKNGSMWERELAAAAIAKHFRSDDATFAELTNLTPWQSARVLEAKTRSKNGFKMRKTASTAAEPLVRAAAIGSIPDDQTDEEIGLIRKALRDSDVIVRATAIERYGVAAKVPPEEWLKTLYDIEKRERSAPMDDARVSAIAAIAKYDHPERVDFLSSLLKDDDPVVRRTVADLFVSELKLRKPQYTPLSTKKTDADYAEIVKWSRQPHTATIHMTRGLIQLALLSQDAPLTTWNFAELAKKRYFDNTSFMRVVPNFVIQGGDPRNDMSGGPGYAIRDEINLQKYSRGAVGMALSGPDTGGSQFFIVHSPQPHLDGGYTIFARVYEGMTGVVDQTERGDKVETISIDEHPPVSSEVIGAGNALPAASAAKP
jgi:cyclophilin family peptidyl-prolyl cis-trans isomerase/HEAT repeat protein